MLKEWKLKSSDSSRVFITSDTHFRHDKDFLYIKRGYSSIKEHDIGLIKIWNERVRPQDQVIHLGDFIFKATKELAEEYFKQLNGKIYVLWGNHNSGIKQLYKSVLEEEGFPDFYEVYPSGWCPDKSRIGWSDKVIFVGDYMKGWINSTPFVASHFAHRIWDFMQKNAVHFCGHSHGSDKESNPDFEFHKRIDVGIENFGGPVSFEQLLVILNKKELVQLDHHDRNTNSSF
jgi:calcineurin-like phosphoesterase family protein